MENLQPPEDLELRNIIQKLANFVARNGPEFEKMTKEKQKDNPKFSFLFSGDYHEYYNYCVMTEKSSIQHQLELEASNRNNSQWSTNNQNWSIEGSQQQGWQQMPLGQQQFNQPPNINQVGGTQQRGNNIQSIQQLKDMIEEKKKETEKQVKESESNLHAQYLSITQQQQIQIESEILAARKSELKRLSDECGIPHEDIDNVIQPIIESCTKDAISNGKNWILHNWTSEANSEFINKYLIDRIIDSNATFASRLHLIYLINDILHHCVRKQIDNLRSSLEDHIVIPSYCITYAAASEEDKSKLSKLLGLWDNNKYLSADTIKILSDPTEGLNKFQNQLATAYESIVVKVTTEMTQQYQNLQQQHQNFVKHIQQEILNSEKQLSEMIESTNQQQQNITQPPAPFVSMMPNFHPPMDMQSQFINPMSMPDFSRPPPGFPQMPPPPQGFMQIRNFPPQMFGPIPPCDVDLLIPSMPYFDLPAGLMAPLVKLENSDYEALDPKLIRLPPPMPPTERLLAAVEAFYAPPSHDRPRDQDGWEKLGLFEFFRAKQLAKKNKIQNIRNIRSVRGGIKKSLSKSPPGFRRKRNSSPVDYKRSSRSPSQSSSSSSDSRSRSRSGSNSKSSSRSRSRSRDRRRTRSRSLSPDRNISQPFYQTNFMQKLSEDNKGHQLLTKMGWSGGGLGQDGAGIVEPIEAGEVRDKSEQFMGLGNQADPYDQFRKNRSVGFNTRMKEKAIAREKAEAKNLAAALSGKIN